MQLLEAEVKYPGRVCNTKFGERMNAVFVSPNGEEITVWSSTNYAPLFVLKRGDKAQLVRDSKGNYRLVEAPTVVNNSDSNEAGWTPEEKRAIATKIEQQAKLMRFCIQTAQRRFEDLVPPEDIRPLATTLFLQAVR